MKNKKIWYTTFLAAALVLTACGNTQETSQTTSPAASTTVSDTTATETTPEPTSETTAEAVETKAPSPSGFLFLPVTGVEIFMHMEAAPVFEQLGKPQSSMETPSCAFQGTDRIYTYSSYEITTYESEGKEYIYDVYFLDDTVTTKEGIYIGCSTAEMISAYGEDYTESTGSYTYKKDGMTLQFITENDSIISIRYNGAPEA